MIAGIDPSFRGCGVVVIGGEESFPSQPLTITYVKLCAELSQELRSFPGIIKVSQEMSSMVACHLGFAGCFEVIIEMPPPRGQYSPGLWMLDGMIINECQERMPAQFKASGCSAQLVKSVIGKGRKAKKDESCKLIQSDWNWMKNHVVFQRLVEEECSINIAGCHQSDACCDFTSDDNLADALIIVLTFAYLQKRLTVAPEYIRNYPGSPTFVKVV